jgi:hypothetical protein
MVLIDGSTSWTPAEEETIAWIVTAENVPRLEAIRRMRRRAQSAISNSAPRPGFCLECGVSLAGRRRGALFCSRAHLMKHRRKSQPLRKQEIIGNAPLEKSGLTPAKNPRSIPASVSAPPALVGLPSAIRQYR